MRIAFIRERLIFLLILYFCPAYGRLPKKVIKINSNGYQGLTIAISQSLPEQGNEKLIQNLKDIYTATSAQLFQATKYHLYFKDVTIVVPRTWSRKPHYQIVSGPQFDMSHVIIDELNPLVGSRPFVSGVTGCSEEGQFIHVDMYSVLSNWKVRALDKFLVHQWGHYRWGLFDEYPGTESPTLKREKPFYIKNGKFLPNVCSDQVTGEFLTNCYDPNSKCKIQKNGLLEQSCKFCSLTPTTARQSLMGYYYLNSISEFCDDTPGNGKTEIHNADSETKQNRYCQGRSNWAVMRDHQDFKGLKAASKLTNTTPTFNIVQQGPHRVVLILDISGSMKADSKLEKLLQATTHFLLNVVDEDTEVGLVTFSKTANIIKQMTRITSQQVREEFVRSLPTVAVGATSIAAGIQKGIESVLIIFTAYIAVEESSAFTMEIQSTFDHPTVIGERDLNILEGACRGTDIDPIVIERRCLQASRGLTVGSFLFIVSDGKETTSPYLNSVTQLIEQAGVTVMSLAFTDKSDIKMVKLSGDTGGRSFLESNMDDSTVLVDAFYQSIGHTADEKKSLVLIESLRTYPVNNLIAGSFHIDGSIGKDTLVAVIGTNVNSLSISVSSPNGSRYEISSCRPRVCTLRLPGILKKGEYDFSITTQSVGSFVYAIQSNQRSSNEKVLTARAWMSGSSLNLGTTSSLKVFTSVTRGYDPVLNANVKAIVVSSKTPVVLVDTGSGADLEADDGIYSAYILPSHVTGNGRFNVRVVVVNKDGTAKSIIPVRRKRRDTDYLSSPQLTTSAVDRFERATQTSEFEVLNFDNTGNDMIPPARITTLELIGTNYRSRQFILQFMAVGDDLDVGNATSYDVRISRSVKELMTSPSNATRINNHDIPIPTEVGTLQSMKVSIENPSVTYFVGIRAVDSNNNTGEMSNLVSLSVVPDSSNAESASWQLNVFLIIILFLFY